MYQHGIGLCIDFGYACPFAFVDMSERNMLQQISECKNLQLFFEQLGALGSYPFEIFDRTG